MMSVSLFACLFDHGFTGRVDANWNIWIDIKSPPKLFTAAIQNKKILIKGYAWCLVLLPLINMHSNPHILRCVTSSCVDSICIHFVFHSKMLTWRSIKSKEATFIFVKCQYLKHLTWNHQEPAKNCVCFELQIENGESEQATISKPSDLLWPACFCKPRGIHLHPIPTLSSCITLFRFITALLHAAVQFHIAYCMRSINPLLLQCNNARLICQSCYVTAELVKWVVAWEPQIVNIVLLW